MTTEELMDHLPKRVPRGVVVGEIAGWLATCDLVKFAKLQPPPGRGARGAGDRHPHRRVDPAAARRSIRPGRGAAAPRRWWVERARAHPLRPDRRRVRAGAGGLPVVPARAAQPQLRPPGGAGADPDRRGAGAVRRDPPGGGAAGGAGALARGRAGRAQAGAGQPAGGPAGGAAPAGGGAAGGGAGPAAHQPPRRRHRRRGHRHRHHPGPVGLDGRDRSAARRASTPPRW